MVSPRRVRTYSFPWMGCVVAGLVVCATVGVFLTNDDASEHGTELALARMHHELSKINKTTSKTRVGQVEDTFKTAYEESLGFFDDIMEEQWAIRKRITKRSEHHINKEAPAKPNKTPAGWYQNNWNDDFSCLNEESVGFIGEGHKWVCDPHRLNKEGCLVYSFGSNGNFRFEKHLKEIAPLCEVHVFDPEDFSDKMKLAKLDAVYHPWGLNTSYTSNRADVFEDFSSRFEKKLEAFHFKTLQDTVAALGHTGRKIDVFKIDCEGCEWRTYRDWVLSGLDLRQILIEVHNYPKIGNQMFEDLHQQGYVIFHSEPNIQWSGGNCVEFSFLKLHKKFFQ